VQAGRRLAAFARALLLVLAITLVAATAALFVSELDAGSSEPAALRRALPVHNAPSISPSLGCVPHSAHALRVALVLRKFDPIALTLTADVDLCASYTLLEQLQEKFGSECPKRSYLTYEVGYAGLVPAQGPTGSAAEVSGSFCSLADASAGSSEAAVAHLGTIVIPLAGAARKYPFDWYAARGDVTLTTNEAFPEVRHVEAGVQTATGGAKAEQSRFELALLNDQGIAPFTLAATGSAGATALADTQTIALRFQREATTRWYVVIIALIPLVLALLLSVALFSPHVSGRPTIGPEMLAGVTAVLLAVLPIRFVLVPSEIPELTLVDYWLGLEMALLAALACFAVWRALGKGGDAVGAR